MKTNCGRCWRENTQAERLPVMLVGRSCMKNFLLGINKVAVCHVREGIIIGFMPQPRRMQERAAAGWRTFDSASIE